MAYAYTLEPPAMAGVSRMKKHESPDFSRGGSQADIAIEKLERFKPKGLKFNRQVLRIPTFQFRRTSHLGESRGRGEKKHGCRSP